MKVEPLTKEYAEKLANMLDEYDDLKDKVHELSRNIIKNSKLAIYAIRREDIETAEKYIKSMQEMRKELKELLIRNLRLASINISLTAEQEFVEAYSLYKFMKEGKYPSLEEINTTVQEYIAGIMDSAGELLRLAVDKMLQGNIDFAKKVKDVIEQIYIFMLHVNPRDYELRRKIDYVTNILNKLQEFIFYKEVIGRASGEVN